MPLMKGKSKSAFQHNVKAEVNAGKPVKQAVAIAYSEKGEHMDEGGEVSDNDEIYNQIAKEALQAVDENDAAKFLDCIHCLIHDSVTRLTEE